MITVAFSGGLDSTAVVWRLLTETTQDLHVHHIDMMLRAGPKSQSARRQAESDAAIRVGTWLHRHGPRGFLLTSAPVTGIGPKRWPHGYDLSVVGMECARVARVAGYTPTAMAWGCTARGYADERLSYARNLGIEAWRTAWPDAPILTPVFDMTRAQEWALLPEGLRALTWSCRKPQPEPCRKCDTCKEMIADGCL